MKIGLTYDLRRDYAAMGFSEEDIAEFDTDATVDALAETLAKLGHEVERVGNVFALAPRLCAGETWELVFNLCEGLFGRSREAQVPALLEAYQIPYAFSDPLTLAVTLDKAVAKQIVRAAGMRTPLFVTAATPEECRTLAARWLQKYPVFVKPLCEGTGKGITAEAVVYDPNNLVRYAERLLGTYRQPVLVEEFLPGREFTVGLVGTGDEARVVGAMEVVLLANADPGVYTYTNKEHCEDRVTYRALQEPALLHAASTLALGAYRALGCRDAGRVDLRTDADGHLHFLEVNPLAGLHPTHSDLPILSTQAGWTYQQLIAAIVESASLRKLPGRDRVEKALRFIRGQQ
jgi:D-alanine-D-alanine ligase